MKKIVMIFAAMAAALSSCQKSELESVSANDGKDIVLNISVSNPGADDTKAIIKTGWAANDEISIWYDSNVQETPDLVVTYNGEKWIQKEGAAISGNTPSTGTGKYAKALYNGKVKVASKDDYTYENNTLTFNIANWKFLTEIQVVVKGLTSASAGNYTLACDKFTPLASTGNGYAVGSDAITASNGTKASAVTGISNADGVAFVFATADYSATAAEYKFVLKDKTSGSEVTKVYKPNVAIAEKEGKSSIKALAIASTKFAVPVNPLYVEIEADYDNDPSTPNTTLKWYRQNLAISDSGKKVWKGGNTGDKPEVKVPGTNENVIVGDYFQWAAHAGYCGGASAADKGLLIYDSFINTKCVGETGSNKFDFKLAGGSDKYRFNTSDATGYKGISPYYSSSYQYYKDASPSTLSRETTYSGNNDDVANIILGDNWRMPTTTEFKALKDATYWKWDDTDKGYYVYAPQSGDAGKKNGETSNTYNKSDALLFFPAAGRGKDKGFNSLGSYGYYWSSSLNTGSTDYAYGLNFYSGDVSQYEYYRYNGFSVRPVSDQ